MDAAFELDPGFEWSVCAYAKHGDRAAVPINCNVYVVCLVDPERGGYPTPRVRACPPGLQFDRDLFVCDETERAGCVPKPDW